MLFFKAWKWIFQKKHITKTEYGEYIYGSAEVVGLMCLKVFCEGKEDICTAIESIRPIIGSSFSESKFSRDIKADHEGLVKNVFSRL